MTCGLMGRQKNGLVREGLGLVPHCIVSNKDEVSGFHPLPTLSLALLLVSLV